MSQRIPPAPRRLRHDLGPHPDETAVRDFRTRGELFLITLAIRPRPLVAGPPAGGGGGAGEPAGRGCWSRRWRRTASLKASGCSMLTMWPAPRIETVFAPVIPRARVSTVTLIWGRSRSP